MGHLLEICAKLIAGRAELFINAILDKGSAVYYVWGCINCITMRSSRPGGHGAQEACFFGQKRFLYLFYQIKTTPDGRIFHKCGLEVGRRYGITLFHEKGPLGALSSNMQISSKQYAVFCDYFYILQS